MSETRKVQSKKDTSKTHDATKKFFPLLTASIWDVAERNVIQTQLCCCKKSQFRLRVPSIRPIFLVVFMWPANRSNRGKAFTHSNAAAEALHDFRPGPVLPWTAFAPWLTDTRWHKNKQKMQQHQRAELGPVAGFFRIFLGNDGRTTAPVKETWF